MTVYSFWIFDRHCNCVFDREWTIPSEARSGTLNSRQNDDTAKLLYGMLFSLQSITNKIADPAMGANNVQCITMGNFRVHAFKTASGLWFLLLTDFKQQNYSQVLQHLYSEVYVKYVVHNWLSPVDFAFTSDETQGQGFRKIHNRRFVAAVESVLQPMLV
ncbi:TRAPP subunit BET5 KNAG_0E04110 [Huiozyma naganishii CBS 8797]|uniref:Trafficking protein particle complex subunit n=1 Tax=Huiozyma naganishii (strain ATCC MYA-139 / BCRC 22969 / CBS 8797 / KCTC 17520 / NBRC 10181 / NCYC 3082 / Yp74L-3) TaxID=1071383 RepID=J7S6Y4_HUIN7|nr:hypothetical protein KNAG_0E04110 [Kazachstania naganishii CBS 8797]CCK70664.1 hypothetical protein KNAG_0E04110 [Kazachstania naganishii CBS 8797]